MKAGLCEGSKSSVKEIAVKHLRVITMSVLIAIAGVLCAATASSQVNIHVNTAHRDRHNIVHHPRQPARVHVNVPVRHHVVRHQYERRAQLPHHDGPENR